MNTRFSIALSVAAIAMGSCLFFNLARHASRGGEDRPLYSTHRYDPYGTAALRELLQERHVEVSVLEQSRLGGEQRGTLIQALPMVSDDSLDRLMWGSVPTLRASELHAWIADGHTVVQFTRQTTAIMRMFGVFVEGTNEGLDAATDAKAPASCREPSTSKYRRTQSAPIPAPRPVAPKDLAGEEIEAHRTAGKAPDKQPGMLVMAKRINARDVPAANSYLALRSPVGFECKDTEYWTPLATYGGKTVAGQYTCGPGRLIVIGDLTPIINDGLPLDDNLAFLLNAVGDGPVVFDEWSHGLGHAGSIMRLIRQTGLTPLVLQAILVLLLYIWSTRGRRTEEDMVVIRARSSMEQVETLGHVYSRVFTRNEAVRRVDHEAMMRMASVLRCTPEALASGHVLLDASDARKTAAIMDAIRLLKNPDSRVRLDTELAKILTLSHAFVEEKKHGRTGSRNRAHS